ncbi:MAG TPA: hypothetical protein VGS02_05070 [Acidobacteriaceae bacterium]|nr:hypothetical protein [Acidobacteriaceae bacterium]
MVKLLSLALLLLPYGCSSVLGSGASQATAHKQPAAQQAQATIQNDPKVLIVHCGAPDHKTENSFFQEGSTVSIQSRTLTYSKAHLSMIYVSSGQGDSWAFSGLVDTQTNHALSTDEAQRTLRERMPCAISQPTAAGDAGSRTQESRTRNRKPVGSNQSSTEGRRG